MPQHISCNIYDMCTSVCTVNLHKNLKKDIYHIYHLHHLFSQVWNSTLKETITTKLGRINNTVQDMSIILWGISVGPQYIPLPCLQDRLLWNHRAAGLTGRCGDNTTYTQHNSASSSLCMPVTGDHDCLTEDTIDTAGLRDLRWTNGFITY